MLAWNIFRYIADFSHLTSIIVLLFRLLTKRSSAGISLRTHILYMVVYITRYCNEGLLDPPVYNIIFKFFYLISGALIIYLLAFRFRKSYNKNHDNMQIQYLLILAIPLAYFTAQRKTWYHLSIAYSLWVEAVAILPQIFLLVRVENYDGLTVDYVFFLSIYRVFYLCNWIYKVITDTGKTPTVVWITGILQTVLYSDFIVRYIISRTKGKTTVLPY